MSPADLKDFTATGRSQLYRALLKGVLEAQGFDVAAVPAPLMQRALTEGRGMELVRHLAGLKRDGGAV